MHDEDSKLREMYKKINLMSEDMNDIDLKRQKFYS